KTIAASADELYDAVVDAERRRGWLPDDRLRERTTTRAKSARYDWDDGPSRVVVTFDVKGPAKTTVVVEHSRLADAAQADDLKAFWRKHLDGLKRLAEGGGHDA
ncbi:MAG: SRPBCC domain-containing protein, partial [Nocardioidaceae bacterium]